MDNYHHQDDHDDQVSGENLNHDDLDHHDHDDDDDDQVSPRAAGTVWHSALL